MKRSMIPVMAIFLGACATMRARSPQISILVDLVPASVERTVIVESITADKEGRLYLPDRVSGNILGVDPKSLNFDTPRRDNMDANGQTAGDGIGASIAQITP